MKMTTARRRDATRRDATNERTNERTYQAGFDYFNGFPSVFIVFVERRG